MLTVEVFGYTQNVPQLKEMLLDHAQTPMTWSHSLYSILRREVSVTVTAHTS